MDRTIKILDGAIGTELQKRGMPSGVCPELWTIDHPEILKEIHRSYIEAGSDIIFTGTFGANPVKLAEYGIADRTEEINRKLISLAKEAAGSIPVGGSVGPCGRFIRPFGEMDFEEAVKLYQRQIRGMLEGGADFIVAETQMDIQEARAILLAIKEFNPDTPAFVSMTYESTGRTLNGTTPEAALITLQNLGADAIGCNCSSGPAEMLEIIRRLSPLAKVPLFAKPNAGIPCVENGRTRFPMDSLEFASYGPEFAKAGAAYIGGCCGTTPEHIRELAKLTKGALLESSEPMEYMALTSAREAVITLSSSPVAVIGERINPTGKKKLQAELREGKFTMVQTMARDQKKCGASMLDINAGMPGIDEKETLLRMISLIAPQSSLPLVIDTTDPEAAEKALRYYPGRALLNSVSGEETRINRLLPAAAKYGAMFILLPIADNRIPATAEERIEIIGKIYAEAKKYGFTPKDILVDGLTMTVSADENAPAETLKTLEWASSQGFGTVLGLSNISFGLPERKWINSAFLAMAVRSGLTHVIANPSEEVLMNIKAASDLLCRKDRNGSAYIGRFADASAPAADPSAAISPEARISSGIINGIRDDIREAVTSALSAGISPSDILEKTMIPAIIKVGELYEKKEYFLPQLIASAETMQMGFSVLEPLLGQNSVEKPGKILFATVEGDIHDIGKNIVILMLRNYGFEVTDLGKDVKAADIVKKALETKPDIIALSALMTTTMVRMPEIISAVKEAGIKAQFIVGGAVVTEDWADTIGAHYAANGVESVKKANEIMNLIRKEQK